jgi:undecaprenyl-diphosphatase
MIDQDTQIAKESNNFDNISVSKIRFSIAYTILFLSAMVVWATVSGAINNISNWMSEFLLDNLGYTNQWSKEFGPRWYIFMNNDISALAGPVIIPLFLVLISVYAYLKNKFNTIHRFLFVIVGGIIFMFITKAIFSPEFSDQSLDIIYGTETPFPSGHTMVSTIFYISLAVIVARTQRRVKVRKYLIVVGCLLVIIIGISRFITGGHTLTEVLAGWALGMMWLTICWLLEQLTTKRGWSEEI